MKEKKEVDLSQKGTLEAFELSDDEMEKVNGGADPSSIHYIWNCQGDCNGTKVATCKVACCLYNRRGDGRINI